MNNKIVKTVDEHNIDRDANVMFAFDLDGSEYVAYRMSRDEEQDNLFVSKVLKNLDGTFNMIDVDDSTEKSKLKANETRSCALNRLHNLPRFFVWLFFNLNEF